MDWISETFYWNGALKYAAVTKDKELIKLLEDKFAPLFTSEKALQPIMNHVDLNMFGSLPLDMYRVTRIRNTCILDCLMPTLSGKFPQMQSLKKGMG